MPSRRRNERDEKDVSTNTLDELDELVFKNNIFNFNENTLNQLGQSFLRLKVFYLWQNWKKILENICNKPYLWRRCVNDIFFIWEPGQEKVFRAFWMLQFL